MPRRLIINLAIFTVAFLIGFAGVTIAAAPPVPDLTRGGVKDNHHDWTLGPTGVRGWIFGPELGTTEARQIVITKVAKGSPADNDSIESLADG